MAFAPATIAKDVLVYRPNANVRLGPCGAFETRALTTFSLTNGINVLDASVSDALLPVIASFGAAVEYLDICGILPFDVDKRAKWMQP